MGYITGLYLGLGSSKEPMTPELGMQQCYSFATTTAQQRNRVSGTRKIWKIFRSRCLDGVSHTKFSNIVLTNVFVACKHGHVGAAVLARAQLCTTHNQTESCCIQLKRVLIVPDFTISVYGSSCNYLSLVSLSLLLCFLFLCIPSCLGDAIK